MSNFNLPEYWYSEKEEHIAIANKTFDNLENCFSAILDECEQCILGGHKIIFFGNGGSAADSQHLATELTIRFAKDRPPIAAIALTTDTSALTAAGNDYGFDFIFSRQLDALGHRGDVAIGLSTSGNSPNILNAFLTAKKKGIITIGFGGKDGGQMQSLCSHSLIVPSNSTARIQEMHITLGHMLCGALEQRLALV